MSPTEALASEVFRTYLILIAAILVVATVAFLPLDLMGGCDGRFVAKGDLAAAYVGMPG